ncbi:DZR domain protein [Natrialba magadii ATCC 43099]|uniref:CopG family transcriptional regulator n=1 Tax=Natrialba magadii (strain ATCC 43099 / DSM 3394 / CCM 3739 / CIP 104546 / IAM 13178 / JCM 8861 / NBRC 102185 / NCIMB 2190 / MS3) TaxID=547559 RepID=D3SQS8_NATMM|nr:zinc ribbon domain-containing protein [Natrialba magadii]ADD04566.1 DZR domain protein [Natrialba magadii ATCC 43099]ELY25223.1 CopG family transcriptional regulator [Natrialba magadii ATCC 43099]
MSKITFRADDDLVQELESLEISKSEAMRQALRSYLGHDENRTGATSEERAERPAGETAGVGSQLECLIESLVREHVDDRIDERLGGETARAGHSHSQQPKAMSDIGTRRGNGGQMWPPTRETQDVNVTISLTDGSEDIGVQPSATQATNEDQKQTHAQSREDVGQDQPSPHSKQPQSGPQTESSETTHACGQCGESVDEDHVYCPNCGEKASRRLFCECGDEYRSDWSFCPGCGRRTPAADVLEPR